jgi:Na+/H+-dicarboxylate symporter
MVSSNPIGRLLQSPASRAGIGLLSGLIVGIVIVSSGSPGARAAAAALEPIGTLWVNAIRMTIVPLVVSLLIAALGTESRGDAAGRLGVRSIALFVALLAGVAVLGILAGPLVMSGLYVDPASAASLRASAVSPSAQPKLPGFAAWLVGLVPANPIKAAADGAMLPMIVFAVAFGVALSRLGPAVRTPTAALFRAFADAMLILVKWVLALAPIGVFALAVGLALHLGTNLAGAVAYFLVAHCALLVGIGALLYVAARVGGGVSLGQFARATAPAQIVALSTRSSVAALPAMIDGAQRVLRISPGIVGVALPLGVSLFRVNTPASWIVSGVFIGKLYGVPLSAAAVATIGVAAIPMSLSVPGIPSGGLFILAPLFVAVGLPVEGIGILIALDAIPDVFKTVVIVTGHMASTTILARRAPKSVSPPEEMLSSPLPPRPAVVASVDVG